MHNGPIFIAGVSFSGKTQLRLMLNAHPRIHITRRTYLWRRHLDRYGDLSTPANLERCLDALFASKGVQALDVDRENVRLEFETSSATYTRLFSIIHLQAAKALGKSIWGVQQNFLEVDADYIFSEIPAARIIHVVRDPFERVAESVQRSPARAGKVGWETALWRNSSRWAERNLSRYSGRYLLVHWERMLSAPEEVMEEVTAFLGLDYYHGLADAVMPDGLEPSYQPAGLSPAEQAFIQRWVGREMTSLGYPPRQERLPLGAGLSLALLEYPLNAIGAILSEFFRQKKLNTTRPRMEMEAA